MSCPLRTCFLASGLALLLAGFALAAVAIKDLPPQGDWPRAQHITCVRNLKQIGVAFKLWSLDHGFNFPFNVSTNLGGTKELCATGPDHYDQNAAAHFRAISNELRSPLILVCPQDAKRRPALGFSNLEPANVTYHMRTGPNISDSAGHVEFLHCPIDGNVLYCDGTVTEARPPPDSENRDLLDLLQFNTRFRSRLITATAVAALGCMLLLSILYFRMRPAKPGLPRD